MSACDLLATPSCMRRPPRRTSSEGFNSQMTTSGVRARWRWGLSHAGQWWPRRTRVSPVSLTMRTTRSGVHSLANNVSLRSSRYRTLAAAGQSIATIMLWDGHSSARRLCHLRAHQNAAAYLLSDAHSHCVLRLPPHSPARETPRRTSTVLVIMHPIIRRCVHVSQSQGVQRPGWRRSLRKFVTVRDGDDPCRCQTQDEKSTQRKTHPVEVTDSAADVKSWAESDSCSETQSSSDEDSPAHMNVRRGAVQEYRKAAATVQCKYEPCFRNHWFSLTVCEVHLPALERQGLHDGHMAASEEDPEPIGSDEGSEELSDIDIEDEQLFNHEVNDGSNQYWHPDCGWYPVCIVRKVDNRRTHDRKYRIKLHQLPTYTGGSRA